MVNVVKEPRPRMDNAFKRLQVTMFMTIKKKFQLASGITGISLLELTIAMGLTGGLLLIDLQHQKNNTISLRQQVASNSIISLKESLRSLLKQHWTLEASLLENNATPLQTPLVASAVLTREVGTIVNNTINNDSNMIRRIVVRNTNPTTSTNTIIFDQASIGGTELIGYRDDTYPNNIRSLDNGSGWVYIRSMWVESFIPTVSIEVDTDNNSSTDSTVTSKGTVNLKMIIWKYTNLIDRPGLNCVANNNCERVTLTIPTTVNLVTDARGEGLPVNRPPPIDNDEIKKHIYSDNKIICREKAFIKSNNGRFNCQDNEYYVWSEEAFVRPSEEPECQTKIGPNPPLGSGCWQGQCCRRLN